MPNFTAVIHEIVPRLAFPTPQTPMGEGNGNGKGREEKGMVDDSLFYWEDTFDERYVGVPHTKLSRIFL